MLNNLLFIGGIGVAEILLLLFIIGIPAVLWLWALIDLLKSDFKNSINKLIWIILIAFLPVLGAILYLLIGRRQKVKASIQ